MKHQAIVIFFFLLIMGANGQNQQYFNYSIIDGNSTPVIFNRDNLLSNQLLTYSFQPGGDRGNLHQLVLSPFKIKIPKRYNFLHETRFNFAQTNGQTTLGIGIGFDTGSPFGQRAKKLKKESINFSDENFIKKSVNAVVGVNMTLFPNFGSPSRDVNQDSLKDNQFSVANLSYTLGLIYRPTLNTSVYVSGYYQQARETPVENTKQVTSLGYAVGFGTRVLTWKQAKTEELIPTSKFIPSVNLGVSLEHLFPIKNAAFLSNGNTYLLGFSPYLDFKITPVTQLRLSLPISVVEGKQDERGFGSFFQFYLQI